MLIQWDNVHPRSVNFSYCCLVNCVGICWCQLLIPELDGWWGSRHCIKFWFSLFSCCWTWRKVSGFVPMITACLTFWYTVSILGRIFLWSIALIGLERECWACRCGYGCIRNHRRDGGGVSITCIIECNCVVVGLLMRWVFFVLLHSTGLWLCIQFDICNISQCIQVTVALVGKSSSSSTTAAAGLGYDKLNWDCG